MSLRFSAAVVVLFLACSAAHADTIYSYGDVSFTLPTNPVPTRYAADPLYYADALFIDDVVVHFGSQVFIQQVGFAELTGPLRSIPFYEFTVADTVVLQNAGSLTINSPIGPFAADGTTVPFFSGPTSSPTLLDGTFRASTNYNFGPHPTFPVLVVTTVPTAAAPEPYSIALAASGLLGVVVGTKKRRRFVQF